MYKYIYIRLLWSIVIDLSYLAYLLQTGPLFVFVPGILEPLPGRNCDLRLVRSGASHIHLARSDWNCCSPWLTIFSQAPQSLAVEIMKNPLHNLNEISWIHQIEKKNNQLKTSILMGNTMTHNYPLAKITHNYSLNLINTTHWPKQLLYHW